MSRIRATFETFNRSARKKNEEQQAQIENRAYDCHIPQGTPLTRKSSPYFIDILEINIIGMTLTWRHI